MISWIPQVILMHTDLWEALHIYFLVLSKNHGPASTIQPSSLNPTWSKLTVFSWMCLPKGKSMFSFSHLSSKLFQKHVSVPLSSKFKERTLDSCLKRVIQIFQYRTHFFSLGFPIPFSQKKHAL
jgi:hypothetical protein